MFPRDILAPAISENADSVAIIHKEQKISYRDLYQKILQLSSGLQSKLKTGEFLAIWLPNCPELLCIYLACLKAGVVPMPLHAKMKEPEIKGILCQSRVKYLITTKYLMESLDKSLFSSVLKVIYVLDKVEKNDRYTSFNDLISKDYNITDPEIHPTAPCFVLHTSGSQAIPKGVMLSWQAISHILTYRLVHTKLSNESISVVASCLTQSLGLYQSLALLAAGATQVLLDSYDTEKIVRNIKKYSPTHIIMVVEAYDLLLHHSDITHEDFSRLIFASVGADKVTSRVQNKFIGLTGKPLYVTYGLTESSWALINFGYETDKCLSIGKPCAGVKVKLLDTMKNEVPKNEIGEIHIRSPRNMLGYLHEHKSNNQIFEKGWLASGDLAYQDEEGYFWYAGRKKNIIVLPSGDNISPVEIEDVLSKHPSILNCHVIGVTSQDGSEEPCAFVVVSDKQLTEKMLKEYLLERLSEFKIPRIFYFVPVLPRGLTGKIHIGDLNQICKNPG